MKRKIRELDAEFEKRSENMNKLNYQLKEKDAECRLNALKISEMKRVVRYR
jgi:hypothetical protein